MIIITPHVDKKLYRIYKKYYRIFNFTKYAEKDT